MNQILESKKVLRRAGYATEVMWHVDDVQKIYACSAKEAMTMIEDVMLMPQMRDVFFKLINDKAIRSSIKMK